LHLIVIESNTVPYLSCDALPYIEMCGQVQVITW